MWSDVRGCMVDVMVMGGAWWIDVRGAWWIDVRGAWWIDVRGGGMVELCEGVHGGVM